MSYDPKCYDLAQQFLSDHDVGTKRNVDRLAQVIQDAIEEFIAELEEEHRCLLAQDKRTVRFAR